MMTCNYVISGIQCHRVSVRWYRAVDYWTLERNTTLVCRCSDHIPARSGNGWKYASISQKEAAVMAVMES